jgi:hypothetical protein
MNTTTSRVAPRPAAGVVFPPAPYTRPNDVSPPLKLGLSDPATDVAPRSLTHADRSMTLRDSHAARVESGSVEQGFEAGRNHTSTTINVHTRRLPILNGWPTLTPAQLTPRARRVPRNCSCRFNFRLGPYSRTRFKRTDGQDLSGRWGAYRVTYGQKRPLKRAGVAFEAATRW